jgi:hypothetical protein
LAEDIGRPSGFKKISKIFLLRFADHLLFING